MTQTWVTFAGVIGAAVISYFVARLQYPKFRAEGKKLLAEADKVVGESYKDLIAELRSEIAANRLEIDKMRTELEWERKRNYQLVAWSKALAAQVVEHGGEPYEYEDFRS